MCNWSFSFTKKTESDLKEILKNKTLRDRIKMILEDIAKKPRFGIGKPERLKHKKLEAWSRRIDRKNRIEYVIDKNMIIIVSVLGHYEK